MEDSPITCPVLPRMHCVQYLLQALASPCHSLQVSRQGMVVASASSQGLRVTIGLFLQGVLHDRQKPLKGGVMPAGAGPCSAGV